MKETKLLVLLVMLFMVVTTTVSAAWREPEQEGLVWIEGEDWDEGNWPMDGLESLARHWIKGTKPFVLSEKRAVGLLISRDPYASRGYYLKWDFEVDIAGKYFLWIRCFPFEGASPFEVRVGDEGWMPADKTCTKTDIVETGDSWRQLAWYKIGNVSLARGRHELQIMVTEASAGGKYGQSIDCMMLVKAPVTPTGFQKPVFELRQNNDEDWNKIYEY